MVADYARGATVYDLAEKFGCNRRTVSALLKRSGVVMRNQPMSSDQINEAVRRYESGQSLAAVAAVLETSSKTILARLRERGVKMRDTHGRECE